MLENELKGKSKVQEWCEKKYEQVYNDLFAFFEKYPDCKNMNVYPIISKILTSNDKISKLKQREFDDCEDLELCFDKFKDIMATINLNVIYVPSQQTFCMFMGWTDRVYKNMLNNSTDDIQDIMQLINEYLIECQMSAGQQGLLKQNLTKFRTQLAGEHGQGLVTQKEQMEDDRSKKKIKTKEELIKELQMQGSKGPTIENAEKLIK
ncbi:MAG: hypothetical protein ACLUVC_02225 [Longibaculum sp.]